MVGNTQTGDKILQVRINEHLVGYLRKSTQGGISFQYDDAWLKTSGKHPISLHLPTESPLYAGDDVYNFFDNLLPDNPAIRAHIQQRFKVKSSHPFDLLEAIGRDCVGAIQLHLDTEAPYDVRAIIGSPLSDKALQERVISSHTAPLGMSKSHEEFRISLAGAQDKTGLLWHEGKWQSPEGTTPTTHIIKLPIGKIHHNEIDLSNSVDNEWLCLKLLELYGLDVTAAERLTIGNTTVLSVERFDRRLSKDKSWIMRLPQEDMCQALGFSPGNKYEADGGPGIPDIMKLLEKSEQPEKDRTDFLKANFLFWLMAAPDGHAKNFSIFIEPNGKFRLTPLYDVISVYPLIPSGRNLQHQNFKMAMSLRGSTRYYKLGDPFAFTLEHFISTAEICNFSTDEMRHIIEEVLAQTEQVIEKAKELLPTDFEESVSTPIFDGIRSASYKFSKQL